MGRPKSRRRGSFEGLRGPKQSAPHQNQDSVLDRGEGRCVEKRVKGEVRRKDNVQTGVGLRKRMASEA